MTDNSLDIYTLFPTPLLVRQIENFYTIKDSLVEDIYKYEEEFPKGEIYSNHGGWHSPTKPQLFHVKRFEKYFDFIVNEVRFCLSKVLDKSINITHSNIINSWANINRRDDFLYKVLDTIKRQGYTATPKQQMVLINWFNRKR